MRVRELVYNWHQDAEYGERDVRLVVGNGVTEIIEHLPRGEGDKCSYLVEFDDGRFIRIFNPNVVEYFIEQERYPEHKLTQKEVAFIEKWQSYLGYQSSMTEFEEEYKKLRDILE